MDLYARLILGIIFLLFSLGMFSAADESLSFLNKKINKNHYYFFSKSILYLLLISFFCISCNGIFLITPLIDYTNIFSLKVVFFIKKLTDLILISFILLIIIKGFLYLKYSLKDKIITFRDLNIIKISNEDESSRLNNKLTFIFLGLPIIYYIFFFPTSLLNLIGDTGYYHLPYVNHIASFGIEKGLVHLNWKYPYYNLTLYGQIPFQVISNFLRQFMPNISDSLISPSLNILYFSGFLLYLKENFIENKDIELDIYTNNNKISKNTNLENKNIRKYLISIYYLLIFSFIPLIGLNLKFSILSYNIDFVLTLLTLILIHNISRSVIFDEYDLGTIILIFLLPIFKLSGVISLIYLFMIYFFLKLKLKNYNFLSIYSFKFFPNEIKPYFLYPLVFVSFSVMLLFLTSYIQSGYLIYPSNFLGQLGDHGLNMEQMKFWKEEIFNFSRFMSSKQNIPNAKYSQWLPDFLRSKVGIATLLIFLYSVFGFISNLYKKNRPVSVITFSYSASILITLFIVILFFPPDLRFYSWLIAIPFYLFTINYLPSIFMLFNNRLLYLTISILIFFISGPLLNLIGFRFPNIKNIEKGTTSFEVKYTSSDKWEHRTSFFVGNEVPIKIPIDQYQCWNIDPPCANVGDHNLILKSNKK